MKQAAHRTDEEYIAGIKARDAGLLDSLYRLQYKTVLFFILSNGGDEQEAKDIYQEGFMVLYTNAQKENFRLECSIKTYLYSICRNLWLNELKKKSKTSVNINDIENFFFIEEKDNENIFNNTGNYKLMKKSLLELGDPCSTVLTDFYITRLNMQQIAAKMNYSNEDNAKNQKYKCLQRLKKIFFGYYVPEKTMSNEY